MIYQLLVILFAFYYLGFFFIIGQIWFFFFWILDNLLSSWCDDDHNCLYKKIRKINSWLQSMYPCSFPLHQHLKLGIWVFRCLCFLISRLNVSFDYKHLSLFKFPKHLLLFVFFLPCMVCIYYLYWISICLAVPYVGFNDLNRFMSLSPFVSVYLNALKVVTYWW